MYSDDNPYLDALEKLVKEPPKERFMCIALHHSRRDTFEDVMSPVYTERNAWASEWLDDPTDYDFVFVNALRELHLMFAAAMYETEDL